MKKMKLETLEDIRNVLTVVKKYAPKLTSIDVVCGSYSVDACSVMGLMSILGNEITFEAIGMDPVMVKNFYREIEEMTKSVCTA